MLKSKISNTCSSHFFASLILSSLTLLSASILSSSTTFADDDIVDQVNVTVSVSCTMSGNGMNGHNADVVNGTYEDDIGTTTLKAFCNDNEGFAIYAIGFTNDQYSGEDHTKLIGVSNGQKITTGTASSGATSNWAMKLNTVSSPTPAYPITLDNGYSSYSQVPDTYTKVAHRDSGTDVGANATGAELTTTYAAYISNTQVADTYSGKVKYTLVHPSSEEPLGPQPTKRGFINYYANASTAEGTMGRQSASDGNTVTLFASNFSRDGYGFAGWSDAFDYATNPNANFYGPNEDVVVPEGTTANGLALYAVWIKSEGNFQDSTKVAQLCGVGGTGGSLIAATYNNEDDADESTWSITAGLSSISALTDARDNQTYAIAKLTDGKCWMIENLRLADTHKEGNNAVATTLTTSNTNNPLNDGTNVTLKHNYSDTATYPTLSATSSDSTSWCKTNSAACYDQSRLRTDNTANRATYTSGQTVSSQNANLYSYGNYYNWYSATAGNGTYSKSSGEVAGDLCPAGWHLPTGTGSGEFGLLSNSLGGYQNNGVAQIMNNTTTPTGTIMSKRVRYFPNNILYSGYADGATLVRRGSYGGYWSSTARSGGTAYSLYFYSSYVEPSRNTNKYFGWSLRCLAST